MGNKIEPVKDKRIFNRLIEWSSITFINSIGHPARSKKEALLGTGAYASVYRGIMSVGPGKKDIVFVAVKIFNQNSDEEYDSLCLNAEKEAAALVGILNSVSDRSGIVSLYGISKGELTPETTKLFRIPFGVSRVALVMGLEPGGSLSSLLHPDPRYHPNPAPLSLEFKIALIKNIANGLRALHAAKYTHGDLKPQNILLCDKAHVEASIRISDFGLFDSKQSFFDISQSLKGYLAYCAPELLSQVLVNLTAFEKINVSLTDRLAKEKAEKERKAKLKAAAEMKPIYQQNHPIATILVQLNMESTESEGGNTNRIQIVHPPGYVPEPTKVKKRGLLSLLNSGGTQQSTTGDNLTGPLSVSKSNLQADQSVKSGKNTTLAGQITQANRQTDMYAFAVICWEILVGSAPYEEEYLRDEKLLLNSVTSDDESINRPCIDLLPSDVPFALRSMILSCWHGDPTQRLSATECFSTASHLLNVASSKRFCPMYDILLVHAWTDKPFLKFIVAFLVDLGYRVYYDECVSNSYIQSEAIKNSAVVLVCANSAYQEARNCKSELIEIREKFPEKIYSLLLEGVKRNFSNKLWSTSGVSIDQEVWDILDGFDKARCCDVSRSAQDPLWKSPDDISADVLVELNIALQPLLRMMNKAGCKPSMALNVSEEPPQESD